MAGGLGWSVGWGEQERENEEIVTCTVKKGGEMGSFGWSTDCMCIKILKRWKDGTCSLTVLQCPCSVHCNFNHYRTKQAKIDFCNFI